MCSHRMYIEIEADKADEMGDDDSNHTVQGNFYVMLSCIV